MEDHTTQDLTAGGGGSDSSPCHFFGPSSTASPSKVLGTRNNGTPSKSMEAWKRKTVPSVTNSAAAPCRWPRFRAIFRACR